MIFFDLDGTLLESNGLWLKIDQTFLQKRGISSIPDDYIHFVTNNVAPKAAEYTRERFGLSDTADEILGEWQDMARHAYCNELSLTKGAKLLLESLRMNEVPMCLLTACLPELCHGALNHHGISSYFRSIHAAIELGMDKRDKDLFPLVAKLQGKDPSQCILIDDAIDYCSAAKSAGFTVIGIQDPSGKNSRDALSSVCDMYIEDLTQIDAGKLMKMSQDLEDSYLATV